jgi:LCP family protein required for cell wall assembly
MKDRRPKERSGLLSENLGKFFNSVKNGWQKLKKGQKAAIIISAAFLVLIGTGIWYYAHVISNPIGTLGGKDRLKNDPDAQEAAGATIDELDKWNPDDYYDKNIINYVLLGFDTNEERQHMEGESWYGLEGFAGARPDSIRVISINLDTNMMNIISIPRDTYVRIANTSTKDKINSSYAHGRQAAHTQGITDEKEIDQMGLDYVMQTISNALGGIPMDYYMAVDFDTVVNFVDKIGGVRYNVEMEIRDENGNLMLEPGDQVLNGTQAFIYLQDRHNTPGGDVGRTQHHTLFLKAMAKQLLQNGKIVDALQLLIFDDDMGTIETNMSVGQLMSTGYIAAKKLNLTDVNPHVLETRSDMMNGISYEVIDQEARSKLLMKVFDYEFAPQEQEDLQDTVPAPPTGFTAQLTGDGIVLSWEPGDSNNNTYNLWRNGEQIATDLTETLYLDTGYASGAVTYELQAVNYTVVSTKITKTVQAGPAAPTNLKAEFDPYTTTIDLTWDYDGDGVTFTIYKGDGDGTGRRLERNIRRESYSDGDVEFDKVYSYWVTAVDDDGVESSRVRIDVPTAVDQCTLTMDVAGSGTGTITPSAGAYAEAIGAVVTITATPTGGSTFAGWTKTGDCDITSSSSLTTTVTVNGTCTVTATFNAPASYTLTMAKAGSGTGNVTPSAGDYPEAPGTVVSISATPTGGSTFAGWTKTGSCDIADAGSQNTSVTVNGDCTVTATFTASTTYTLTMEKGGTGDGTLTPAAGPSTQTKGSPVSILASPDGSSTFVEWQVTAGTATFDDPNSASTTVTASANCTIKAIFNSSGPTMYNYSYSKDESIATGTVDSSQPSGSYAAGTTITITAVPDDPSTYTVEWTGVPSGATAVADGWTFDINENVTIGVKFVTP